MKINLNTLCSAITTIVISSVLNAKPIESSIYNGAYLQHHSVHPDYGYMKGYAMPTTNSLQYPYNYQALGYQHPHPHLHQHQHQHPYPHHHHHHNHQEAPQVLHEPHPHPHQQTHQHNEDHYLREYAKDPKNLRNGILQNGAITYDLGMPRYDILNAHEMPEIITSDQPHYQEHLKQLQQTQNFTLEDFGATTLAPTTIADTTTNKPMEEPSTLPSQPHLGDMSSRESKFIQKSVNEEVANAKEKIQQVHNDIKTKVDETPKAHNSSVEEKENSNVYVIRKHEGLSKKMKPSSFKAPMEQEHPDKGDNNTTKDSESQSEPTNNTAVSAPESNSDPQRADSATQEEMKANENQATQGNNYESPQAHAMYVQRPNDQMQPPMAFMPAHHSSFDDRSILRHIPAVPMPVHYSGYLPYHALPPHYNNVLAEHMPMASTAPSNVQRLYRSAFASTLNKREKAKESPR